MAASSFSSRQSKSETKTSSTGSTTKSKASNKGSGNAAGYADRLSELGQRHRKKNTSPKSEIDNETIY
jgi:hypothetical protein